MRGFRKKHFSSFIRKYGLRGKKVIEIGCGTGENLALMEECGMRAYGIEYSSCGVKKCIRDGLRASKEFITSENYRNTNGPFDSFYILSFLEHLPNPNTILGGIRNNLRDNAVGIVEVPNFDMIIKNHLFSEFMIDHLYYFTRKTLSTTLEINGFDVLECRPVFHDYIISAVVKKRSIANFSHFQEKKNQIKIEINKFINRFKSHKVGVWGAGHQSLAVLSSLNLGKDIKYVIDSAKFKQGKFTPVTHIPIVSPSELDDNPVEAIIIIAGSYSDEVVKLLNSKIKNKPKSIAILRESGLEII
jgi:SAM-dependent methyltransferase